MERLGLVIFTIVEDAALVVWLALARSVGLLKNVGGVATLIVGFFIEHVIAYNVKTTKSLLNLQGVPKGLIFVNALVETIVVWVPWLLLWPIQPFTLFGYGIPIYAILYVYPVLVVEHSLTDAIFKGYRGKKILQNLWNPRTIGFTILEGTGCNAWLVLVDAGLPVVGVVVLVVFQYLEHRQAIALARSTY